MSWIEDFQCFVEKGSWSASNHRQELLNKAKELLKSSYAQRTNVDFRVKFLLSRDLSLNEIDKLFDEVCAPQDHCEFLQNFNVISATDKAPPKQKKPTEKELIAMKWRVGSTVYACEDPVQGNYYPIPLLQYDPARGSDFFRVSFLTADGTQGPSRYLPQGLKGVVADVFPTIDLLSPGMEVIGAVPNPFRGHYEEYLIIAVNQNDETVDLQHLKNDTIVKDVYLTEIRTLEHPNDIRDQIEAKLQAQSLHAHLKERVMSTGVFQVKGARARSANAAEMTGSVRSMKALTTSPPTTIQERQQMGAHVSGYNRYSDVDREDQPEFMRTYSSYLERYGEGYGNPRQMPTLQPSQKNQSRSGFGVDLTSVAHVDNMQPLLRFNPILEVALQCNKGNTLFVDADFPPSRYSLYGTDPEADIVGDMANIEWRRASEVLKYPIVQAAGSKPFELKNGTFSPPWLVQLLGVFQGLPEFEECISPGTDAWLYGAFSVRLYIDSTWYFIVLDDFFPFDVKKNCFVSALSQNPQEMYPMILEKALAKMEGSYAKLYQKANPNFSLRFAWDALTAGHSRKLGLKLLPKKSESTCANLHEILQKEVKENYILVRVNTKCNTPQISLLNSLGFSVGEYVAMTGSFQSLHGDYFFFISNPWGGLPPCPADQQQALLRNVSPDLIEYMNSKLNSVAQSLGGLWVTFPILTELFESLYAITNFSNAQKGIIPGTFAGHNGGSIFDYSLQYSANPQIFLTVPQSSSITVEFRLQRRFRSNTLKRNALRMHLHVLPSIGFEEPITGDYRPDNAMSSNLVDLVDDEDALEYPVVSLSGTLNAGAYLLIPDIGKKDSSEEFVIRVFSDFAFSARVLV